MVTEIEVLTEWIPEQMTPGTAYVLENTEMGDEDDPYWAVLACPECGVLGLITRKQAAGLSSIICGSDVCSCEFFLRDDQVIPRKPS